MNAFDYGRGFVVCAGVLSTGAGEDGSCVYWAFLLHKATQAWHLFGINIANGQLVQPVAELKRGPTQCTGSSCMQPPVGFQPSVVQPGLAFGLDVDAPAGSPAGFQVAELNLTTSTIRLVGKIPPGQNADLNLRFLATPWPGMPFGPADEIYYALLTGDTGPAIYGVNVTHGGEVISKDTPWEVPSQRPRFVHWLPTRP
jgi:hypothetical protein